MSNIKTLISLSSLVSLVATSLAQSELNPLVVILQDEATHISGFEVLRMYVRKPSQNPYVKGGQGATSSLIRQNPKTIMRFSVGSEDSAEVAKKMVIDQMYQDARARLIFHSASGMPLGQAIRLADGRPVAMDVAYDKWLIQFSCRYDGRKDPNTGKVVLLDSSRDADSVIGESVLRRIVGRLAALDASSATSLRIGSANVAAKNTQYNELQLNLSQFCAAKGISLNYNAQTSMASFQYSDKQVVIPLASNKIKVGATWHQSKGVSLLINNQWYVPKPLLDAATTD